MSEIGYDITRGGITVHQLPEIPFNSVKWSLTSNTQISTSPFTNAGQTNELAGARWNATFSYNQAIGKDKTVGQIRAFLAKLRGAAGRFYAYDPSWCNQLGDIGINKTVSVAVNLPELIVEGGNLFPALDLYPSETLYPNTGSGSLTWPAYSFTLSYTYDADTDLYLVSNLEAGANQCTVNSINDTVTFTNSNPWDYSQGVRPEYDDALAEAIATLNAKLAEITGDYLLCSGDYIRIDDALRMVVDDFDEGDTVITFEPPLIHPATSGTKVNYKNVGVIMRLIDDEQANFSVDAGQLHDKITFSAIEAL